VRVAVHGERLALVLHQSERPGIRLGHLGGRGDGLGPQQAGSRGSRPSRLSRGWHDSCSPWRWPRTGSSRALQPALRLTASPDRQLTDSC
jgi:hypothetical protein